MADFRKTTQHLMPAIHETTPPGQYNLYPVFPLPPNTIAAGYTALAEHLTAAGTVVIDGYPGVLWGNFYQHLDSALLELGVEARWVDVQSAMLPPGEIDDLVAPYLGGADPLFGFRYPGTLRDFFDPQTLRELRPDPGAALNILYGTGAALAGWGGTLVYVDVPKNEIQFRAGARAVRSLGAGEALDPEAAYRRGYFIDWVAANRHKANLLPAIDWFVDEQRPDEPTLMPGEALREALRGMARRSFRARPWFQPGPWGGQWIIAHVPQLAGDVPNYAGSFELVAPESGLVFESGGMVLEVSFDMLMFQEYEAVLGECAPYFQHEFPIRCNLLDSLGGGSPPVQCHPRPEYIRRHFGEAFTQDECYYILDSAPGAKVYLGFCEEADPAAFKDDLLRSAQTGQPVEIERYLAALPVQEHDLLLIPSGTAHGAGRDTLVLGISATPYLFTFHLYDWLGPDPDGKPRSLQIERAFENLDFDRRGERIQSEFVSRPTVLASGPGWTLEHLPTHPDHFYDVHRLSFTGTVEVETGGSCHVLSLVEGRTALLEGAGGEQTHLNYAETLVVPAAAGRYRLTSEDGAPLRVLKTFIKPREQWAAGVVPGA